MAVSNLAMSEDLGIKNFFRQIKYYHDFYKNNPGYFRPDGFLCFVGPQGSGKSLSAVNYVYRLLEMYPNALLVTNLELEAYPVDNKRVFEFTGGLDISKYRNGIYGVIFLIDEISLYYGSAKGSNNIDPEVAKQICQQRKQRIHIVSTTQYFAQLNIALRRNFDSIVYCQKKFFGYMQKNQVIVKDSIKDSESSDQVLEGKVVKTYRYFKDPDMFKRYDTFKVIDNDNFKGGLDRSDIYGIRFANNS